MSASNTSPAKPRKFLHTIEEDPPQMSSSSQFENAILEPDLTPSSTRRRRRIDEAQANPQDLRKVNAYSASFDTTKNVTSAARMTGLLFYRIDRALVNDSGTRKDRLTNRKGKVVVNLHRAPGWIERRFDETARNTRLGSGEFGHSYASIIDCALPYPLRVNPGSGIVLERDFATLYPKYADYQHQTPFSSDQWRDLMRIENQGRWETAIEKAYAGLVKRADDDFSVGYPFLEFVLTIPRRRRLIPEFARINLAEIFLTPNATQYRALPLYSRDESGEATIRTLHVNFKFRPFGAVVAAPFTRVINFGVKGAWVKSPREDSYSLIADSPLCPLSYFPASTKNSVCLYKDGELAPGKSHWDDRYSYGFFEDLYDYISAAEHFVFFCGWDIDWRVRMGVKKETVARPCPRHHKQVTDLPRGRFQTACCTCRRQSTLADELLGAEISADERELWEEVCTLGQLLRMKASQGLEIIMLVWMSKGELVKTDSSSIAYFSNLHKAYPNFKPLYVVATTPGLGSLGDSFFTPFLHTHHQKLVICDALLDEQGRLDPSCRESPLATSLDNSQRDDKNVAAALFRRATQVIRKNVHPKTDRVAELRDVVGFIGGLDLTGGRRDNDEHSLVDPSFYREQIYYQNNLPVAERKGINEGVDEQGVREPWHDVASRISGPSAYHCLKNFLERVELEATRKSRLKISRLEGSDDDQTIGARHIGTATSGYIRRLFNHKVMRRYEFENADQGVGGKLPCGVVWEYQPPVLPQSVDIEVEDMGTPALPSGERTRRMKDRLKKLGRRASLQGNNRRSSSSSDEDRIEGRRQAGWGWVRHKARREAAEARLDRMAVVHPNQPIKVHGSTSFSEVAGDKYIRLMGCFQVRNTAAIAEIAAGFRSEGIDHDSDLWTVQVLRSIDSRGVSWKSKMIDEWFLAKENAIEQTIYWNYIYQINRAKRFIYIENQYFYGSLQFIYDPSVPIGDFEGDHADWRYRHLICHVIAERICEKIRMAEPFCVYIVTPQFTEGDPQHFVSQALIYEQFLTMRFMYKRIAHCIHEVYGVWPSEEIEYEAQAATLESTWMASEPEAQGDTPTGCYRTQNPLGSVPHPRDYLKFFNLAQRHADEIPVRAPPQKKKKVAYGQFENRRGPVYLHSKLMIVDDEYITMGSANINNRSMVGAVDTEINVGMFEPKHRVQVLLPNSIDYLTAIQSLMMVVPRDLPPEQEQEQEPSSEVFPPPYQSRSKMLTSRRSSRSLNLFRKGASFKIPQRRKSKDFKDRFTRTRKHITRAPEDEFQQALVQLNEDGRIGTQRRSDFLKTFNRSRGYDSHVGLEIRLAPNFAARFEAHVAESLGPLLAFEGKGESSPNSRLNRGLSLAPNIESESERELGGTVTVPSSGVGDTPSTKSFFVPVLAEAADISYIMPRGAVHRFRMACFKEHFGEGDWTDPGCLATGRAVLRRAHANMILYTGEENVDMAQGHGILDFLHVTGDGDVLGLEDCPTYPDYESALVTGGHKIPAYLDIAPLRDYFAEMIR